MVRSLRRISAHAGAPTASHSAAASTQSPERAPRIRQTRHYSSPAGGREPPSSVGGGGRYGPLRIHSQRESHGPLRTSPVESAPAEPALETASTRRSELAPIARQAPNARSEGADVPALPAPSKPPQWWRGRSPRSNGGHSDARLECGEAGCGNERAVAAGGGPGHPRPAPARPPAAPGPTAPGPRDPPRGSSPG